MTTKFRTQFNYKPDIKDSETNDLPSKTVPDMTYTVRELLQKYVTGIPVQVSQRGIYDEAPNLDDFDETRLEGLDEFQIRDLLSEATLRLHTIRTEAEQRKKDGDTPSHSDNTGNVPTGTKKEPTKSDGQSEEK